MRVAFGNDHRGYPLRQKVLDALRRLGHEVVDVGTFSPEPVDYPDIAELRRPNDPAERGGPGNSHLRDRSGNVYRGQQDSGVRAAPCHDDLTAEMSRRHNDANVLCLSADILGEQLVDRMVEIWLSTPFEGGRHSRRVGKIAQLEEEAKTLIRQQECCGGNE